MFGVTNFELDIDLCIVNAVMFENVFRIRYHEWLKGATCIMLLILYNLPIPHVYRIPYFQGFFVAFKRDPLCPPNVECILQSTDGCFVWNKSPQCKDCKIKQGGTVLELIWRLATLKLMPCIQITKIKGRVHIGKTSKLGLWCEISLPYLDIWRGINEPAEFGTLGIVGALVF